MSLCLDIKISASLPSRRAGSRDSPPPDADPRDCARPVTAGVRYWCLSWFCVCVHRVPLACVHRVHPPLLFPHSILDLKGNRERSGHPRGLPSTYWYQELRFSRFPPQIFLLSTKNSKIPKKTAQICLWIDLLIWSVICGFDPTKPCLRSWSSFILRFPNTIWPIFHGFEDPRRGFPLKNTSSSLSDSRPESPA